MSLGAEIDWLMGDGEVLQEEVNVEDELRVKLRKVPDRVQAEARSSCFIIRQAFILKPNDDTDTRVREEFPYDPIKWAPVGEAKYTVTMKYRPLKQESETEISPEMYKSYMDTVAFSKQEKVRYKWQGWDIDEFNDGGVVAEYEKGWKDECPRIPECFEVIKE